MIVELNGLALDVSLLAWRNGTWLELALTETDRGLHSKLHGIHAELSLDRSNDRIDGLSTMAA